MDYNEDFTFKVILPAGMIPDGETVTKIAGERRYRLRTSLKIYGTKEFPDIEQVINADGAKFMIDGCVNIISNDKELVWHVSEHTLLDFLSTRSDPTQQ